MSTVPLGFRGQGRDAAPSCDHVENIFRAALALDELHARSGVDIVLALEPEPWCLLETMAEAVAWFEDFALPFAASHGNEAAMRRHIGLCLDLCHAFVVGEDPVACLRDAQRCGLRVGKVQLSSALAARGSKGCDGLRRRFRDPVYLHQTFEANGRVGPFVDIEDQGFLGLNPLEADVFRCHYHVPLHWHGDADVDTSHDVVVQFLEAIEAEPSLLPEGVPLEVETYTNPQIVEELAFVVERLLGLQRGARS